VTRRKWDWDQELGLWPEQSAGKWGKQRGICLIQFFIERTANRRRLENRYLSYVQTVATIALTIELNLHNYLYNSNNLR